MPLVRITLSSARSPEFLRHVGDAVHEALVAQANVPADDRFQVFQVAQHLVADPAYGGVQRSEELIVVEITLNSGRTVEVKRALYADIAARLAASAGVRPDDVLVNLIEVSRENWSFGGGRATYA